MPYSSFQMMSFEKNWNTQKIRHFEGLDGFLPSYSRISDVTEVSLKVEQRDKVGVRRKKRQS